MFQHCDSENITTRRGSVGRESSTQWLTIPIRSKLSTDIFGGRCTRSSRRRGPRFHRLLTVISVHERAGGRVVSRQKETSQQRISTMPQIFHRLTESRRVVTLHKAFREWMPVGRSGRSVDYKRALTMTLPFWLGRSKILSIDHDDSGANRGARVEAWDGATERVRRDDGAGGSDELLLGAGVRADLGT